MKVVTPSLFVGTVEETVHFLDLYWCGNHIGAWDVINEAIEVIKMGNSALIPEKDWKVIARAILRELGATPEWTASVIRMAETGKV